MEFLILIFFLYGALIFLIIMVINAIFRISNNTREIKNLLIEIKELPERNEPERNEPLRLVNLTEEEKETLRRKIAEHQIIQEEQRNKIHQ